MFLVWFCLCFLIWVALCRWVVRVFVGCLVYCAGFACDWFWLVLVVCLWFLVLGIVYLVRLAVNSVVFVILFEYCLD